MHEPLRFAIIEDELINLEGSQQALQIHLGFDVPIACGFVDAETVNDWSVVDYVLCDLADPTREDTHYPAFKLIQRIKSSPSPPILVAVTGYKGVFEEPVVRRLLLEAGADAFIWRPHLSELLKAVKDGEIGPDEFLSSLPSADAPDEIDELGVTSKTNLLRLVQYLDDKGRETLRKPTLRKADEVKTIQLRAGAEAAASDLKARSADGQPKGRTLPFFRTLRSLFDRASQLPEKYR